MAPQPMTFDQARFVSKVMREHGRTSVEFVDNLRHGDKHCIAVEAVGYPSTIVMPGGGVFAQEQES